MTLTIAVLTGRRPDLLQRTLDSFVQRHPGIWSAATRTVLHNSGDEETQKVLNRHEWHNRTTTTGDLLPIGEASQILGRQVKAAGTEFVLRLEDDFEAREVEWWDDTVGLLDHAVQVRLQVTDQRVRIRCQVCHKPIRWFDHDGHRVSRHAHYTHRPSLMRTEDFLALFPYDNERDAQHKLHGRSFAQHVPGVFAHIADRTRSLKKNGGRA